MDSLDGVTAEEDRLLINAAAIGIYRVTELLEIYGGIAVPAHIDRGSFSVLSNLGTMPAEMGFKAAELTRSADLAALRRVHPELAGTAVITNSDAHRLEDIYDAEFELETEAATPEAVIAALKHRGGLTLL
jgi:3',5'-nucleoside bisphosphate phosphatase